MPATGWRHGIITPGDDPDFESKLRAVCGWFDTRYKQSHRPYTISEHDDPEREYHVHIVWHETSNSGGLSNYIRQELGLGFRTRRLFCFNHTNAYLHQGGKRVVKVSRVRNVFFIIFKEILLSLLRSEWDEKVPEGHHLVDIKITDPALMATMGQRAVIANFHVLLDPMSDSYQTLTKELLGQLKKIQQMGPNAETKGSDSQGQSSSYQPWMKQSKQSGQKVSRRCPYILPK